MNSFRIGVLTVVIGILAVATSTATAASISAKQASLDEHQDACTDSGGTLTSWHFIINQVSPITNAPASITVTWSNDDVEVVPLDRTTGPVAHYEVSGSATHTLIQSATATIYDGWTGQFNLSSVECEPPLDACADFDGRTVIEINTLLGNPANGLSPMSAVIPVNIAPGTYTVTLGSFDDHVAHPLQNQLVERWFARFGTASGDVNTTAISDLPEEPTTSLNEVVGEVTFASTATTLTAIHFLAGGTFNSPESILATCVALDPVLD